MESVTIHISIVIVNYKSWTHLTNCLNSLQKIECKELKFEVIVVDNFSDDDKLESFRHNYPNYQFIENSGNNGFANGCNLGAEKSVGEYLLFLNPDTIVSKDPILKMFTFLNQHENFGIVSCNQRNVNNSYEKSIRFFPDFKTLFGFFRAINSSSLKNNIQQENEVLYPDWVSGAVVFISKIWFDKIKGWNEDYWMYYEDVDLSKKVQNLGGKVALLTNAEIIHNHGGSSRINIKTASITKTEVLISKHVYINNHFSGIKHFILQFLVVFNNLLSKIILGILGVFLFFIPKLRLNLYLLIKLITYYFNSLVHNTWLSFRSMKHPNNNK